MFLCAAVAVALCVVGGSALCPAAGQPPATTLATGWLADASRAFLNAHSAHGRFQDRPFVARQALFQKIETDDNAILNRKETVRSYDGYALYLMAGAQVTEDDLLSLAYGAKSQSDRFEITLYLQPGKNIAHRTVTVSAQGRFSGVSYPGGQEFLAPRPSPVTVALAPCGADSAARIDLKADSREYTLRLRIDAVSATGLQGAIYLCINDGKRSYVEGRFSARSVEAMVANLSLKRIGALGEAIRKGDAAKLRALLQETPVPDGKLYFDRRRRNGTNGKFGYETLLTTAVSGNAADCVNALLTAGADVDLPNGAGTTPLMLAASAGNVKLVDLLLAHGAQATVADPAGCTALHFAARRPGNSQACDRLLAAGADVNALDKRGWTPLIEAVHAELLDMARWLVDHRADVNHADRQGHAAFYYADTDAMRVLLYQAGAKP
jgi:hypothetical protein